MWHRFFSEYSGWLVGMGVASVSMFVASLVLIPMLIVRMRPDYFLEGKQCEPALPGLTPGVRWVLWVLKNLLGVVLMVLGISMLLGPGQGVLTILLSFSLLSFPGKRRFELRLMRLPGLLAAINRLRKRAGRDPMVLPD